MYLARMKEIREDANLRQKDVAAILGVKKGSYSMWECGSDPIPLRRLVLFCDYFDVSLDYIANLTNHRKYLNSKKGINLVKTSENLKLIREKFNLTQLEMANSLNIFQPTLSRYENNKNLILGDTLIYLASKYHVSIDEILGKIDKKTLN